jgi:hypothetical protein
LKSLSIRIDSLEEERLLVQIVTPDLPSQVKEKIYSIIEEFEEQRPI